MENDVTRRKARHELPHTVERQIVEAIKSIRYGTVVISIQDGRVVQIDSTEKQRISAESCPS